MVDAGLAFFLQIRRPGDPNRPDSSLNRTVGMAPGMAPNCVTAAELSP
jgi:hypothetical protein